MFNEIVGQPLVVFSGAGASAALKLRTTGGMENHLTEIKRATDRPGRRGGDMPRLVEAARAYFKKGMAEPVDLEELLSFLVDAKEHCRRWKDTSTQIFGMTLEELRSFLSALNEDPFTHLVRAEETVLPDLIDATYEMIRDHYSTIDGKAAVDACEDAYRQYQHLVDLIVGHVLLTTEPKVIPWFTTNYDWVIKRACEGSGGRWLLKDGFRSGSGSEYDPDNFAIAIDSHAIHIALFKLHGSTSWRRYRGDPQRAFKTEEPPNLVPVDQLAIVYPRIGIEKEDINYTFFSTGYEYFRECLRHAKAFLLIGFSLRDRHVAQPLADAILQRPEFRVINVWRLLFVILCHPVSR